MIIEISDSSFRDLFRDEKLNLPIRWTGEDYYAYLEEVLETYLFNVYLKQYMPEMRKMEIHIKKVCNLLKKSVLLYLNGMPSKAYMNFKTLMNLLMETPLKVYGKSIRSYFEGSDGKTNLFRVTYVKDKSLYNRKRLFHTPYNLRSKVIDCRYSIAGYPCLYLGTNLELCCKEACCDLNNQYSLASRFKLERNIEHSNIEISIIDLAIKPQDFSYGRFHDNSFSKNFDNDILSSYEVKSAYLLWFPIIAACSFIRAKESHPFAAEYIVPHLLMQWARIEMEQSKDYCDSLIGIRYFSCESEKTSEMGFNYAFPVTGKQDFEKFPFCSVLMRTFYMTKPYYLNEYEHLSDCESAMVADNDLKYVDE